MNGKHVKIISERYQNKTGIITESFPAGMYDAKEIFIVKYDNDLNSGMFSADEFEVIESDEESGSCYIGDEPFVEYSDKQS